jgi:hypothetical protein
MNREEYQSRRTEFALRGQELGQAKLCDLDVIAIRSAARQRESLRAHIRDTLSNDALAKQFGVHVRSIEKIMTRQTWTHIA